MIRLPLTLGVLTLLCISPLPLRAQSGPVFPSRLDLEKQWESFLSKEITAVSLAAILKEDPEGGQLIRWGDDRHTSIWAAVQRKLAAEPKLAALLRDEQDREAQALVEQSAGDLDKLMVLARRFPWALSVHQALLDAGSQALQRGQTQLAHGCFQDVLTRAADAGLRARAQVGLWLAVAHEADETALENAFTGIDPTALYPWLGKQTAASDIRARLLRKSAPAALPLKELERNYLDVPGSKSWVFIQPAVHGEGLAVAGPSSLNWYDGSQSKPTWSKEYHLSPSGALWGGLVAAPFQPTVAQGRLFTRWGIQSLPTKVPGREYNLLVNVAAFDLKNGSQVWSTAFDSDWADLCPVNDPVVADGRLYLLTVSRTKEYSPVFLVCLDAEQGRVLWKRELVKNHTTLKGVGKVNVDLAHFGLPVTVAHGNVYCLTNMGVTACCDARDGLIQWVRTYPQDKTAATLTRPGSAPFIAGGRAVFLPRDAAIVFAVDLHSGELAWLKTDESALQVIGSLDNTVILAGSRKIAALKVDTGAVRWERDLPDPAGGRTVLAGQAIYAATRTRLYRLDAKTGAIVEEQDVGKLGPLEGMILRGKTLFFTSIGSPAVELTAALPNLTIHTN